LSFRDDDHPRDSPLFIIYGQDTPADSKHESASQVREADAGDPGRTKPTISVERLRWEPERRGAGVCGILCGLHNRIKASGCG
jgi:hypothetical protein